MTMPNLNEILAIILAGGQGSRLYPLTKLRSKPAVPMAGKYRLIDIPISNCINSNIFRIAVLTQFNSVSLNRHITNTYNFDAFHTGWVQIWAAQQTIENAGWYQGTADAIRKQIFQIQSVNAPYTLILAGDHLYRMDYASMAESHWKTHADITVAVQPVPAGDAPRYGLLKRNAGLKITDFAEKPKDPERLKEFISRDDPEKPYLASMGIYLFNTDVLIDLLTQNAFDDFGSHVIPSAIQTHSVYGYDFEGYWEDIGTIRSFYETNLALATRDARFDLFDAVRPVYSHARFLPGSRIEDSCLHEVLIAEGCCIRKADITHSVVGLRSQIGEGVKIKDTIIMGSDYYDSERPKGEGSVPLGIGAGSQIEGTIIDKNARLGANVTIRPFPRGTDITRDEWVVRDGIVVIPKGTTLLPGTYIGPGSED
jgi:glucose-1-phosphate adenylyltransferase